MAVSIITYPGVVREAVYDAMAFDSLVGASGFFYGGALTKRTANEIVVGTGFGCIKGRIFNISEPVEITVPAARAAGMYGKVWAELNLAGGTPITIKASTTYSSNPANIVMQENENINFTGGAAHQMEIGYFSVDTTGVLQVFQTNGGNVLLDKTKFDALVTEVADLKAAFEAERSAQTMTRVNLVPTSSATIESRGNNYVLYNKNVAHVHISMYAVTQIPANYRICWCPIGTDGIQNVYCGVGGVVLNYTNTAGLVAVNPIPAGTVFTVDFSVKRS